MDFAAQAGKWLAGLGLQIRHGMHPDQLITRIATSARTVHPTTDARLNDGITFMGNQSSIHDVMTEHTRTLTSSAYTGSHADTRGD